MTVRLAIGPFGSLVGNPTLYPVRHAAPPHSVAPVAVGAMATTSLNSPGALNASVDLPGSVAVPLQVAVPVQSIRTVPAGATSTVVQSETAPEPPASVAWATAQMVWSSPAVRPARVVENGVVLWPCAVTARVCTTVPFTVMSTLSREESMVLLTTLGSALREETTTHSLPAAPWLTAAWRFALHPAPAMAKALMTVEPTSATGAVVPSPSVSRTITLLLEVPCELSRFRPLVRPTSNWVPPLEVNSLRSLLNAAGGVIATVCALGNAATPTAAMGERTVFAEAITLWVAAFSQLRMVPHESPDAEPVLPEVSRTKARSVSFRAAPWPRSTVPVIGTAVPATRVAPSAGAVSVVVTAVPPPTVPASANAAAVVVERMASVAAVIVARVRFMVLSPQCVQIDDGVRRAE